MTRHPVPDLLPGTLDLLILRTLQTDSLHGWAISERIQQISQDVLQINQGSLYLGLHRLKQKGSTGFYKVPRGPTRFGSARFFQVLQGSSPEPREPRTQ
jgi:DNA-binding PadR family transcriptional regulator